MQTMATASLNWILLIRGWKGNCQVYNKLMLNYRIDFLLFIFYIEWEERGEEEIVKD